MKRHLRTKIVLLAATVLTLALAGIVSAFSGNPLDPAEGFNVFTSGDFYASNIHSEGPIAAGGDFYVDTNGYYTNGRNTADFVDTASGDTQPTSLLVGGQVLWTGNYTLQLQGNSYVKIGDDSNIDVLNEDQNGTSVNTRIVPTGQGYAGPQNLNLGVQQPVASVSPATLPIDFASAFATMTGTSTELSSCVANDVTVEPTTTSGFGKITSLANGTNVLTITADEWDEITFENVKPTATSPLLINVTDSGTVVWDTKLNALAPSDAQYILINFPNATDLTLSNNANTVNIYGSVLAPLADVTFDGSSNIDGQVVSKTFIHNGGELHPENFSAELECQTSTAISLSNVSATGGSNVTLVAIAALLTLAAITFGVMIRRRPQA